MQNTALIIVTTSSLIGMAIILRQAQITGASTIDLPTQPIATLFLLLGIIVTICLAFIRPKK
jgi:hypothetical protein